MNTPKKHHFAPIDGEIAHEKRVKGGRREWKVELAKQPNPDRDDLHSSLIFLCIHRSERDAGPSTG
jgi:hypothetical protein